MTHCNSQQMEFQGIGTRKVVAAFDGGMVTSDAGGLLLREVNRGSGIIGRFAACFTDHRDADQIEHSVAELTAQRIFGIALGYEDLNDHDSLRRDPILAALVGKVDPTGQNRRNEKDKGAALAGKSTLNRLELTEEKLSEAERYCKIVYDKRAIESFFIDEFLRVHRKKPKELIIDLDATDDPLHGEQEGAYFHGYYDCYCYLPLYMFIGHSLLSARLRTSDCDPIEGVIEDVTQIVQALRKKWPGVRIIIRGDSGFCREEVMAWCESNDVGYVLGLRRNKRLEKMIAKDLKKAKKKYKKTKRPAKRYKNLKYRTLDSWSHRRRVVAKAEHLENGENPRFVVTTLTKDEAKARALYEDIYCARGDMENRIKEQQMGLFADRTSTHTLRANQLRLWFSSVAYVLMNELRRVGLRKTGFKNAQCWTIREKLFKIGAVISFSVRRMVISMASAFPYWKDFQRCLRNIQRYYPQMA
jgi:hypothetical protein